MPCFFAECCKRFNLILFFILAHTIGLSGCSSQPYYNSPPLVPVPVTPENLTGIERSSQITFVWSAVTNAAYYDFHIFDRTTNDIDRFYRSELNPASVCDDQQCLITMRLDMPVSKGHAWRVRAGNNAGRSEWSRSQFEIIPE